ncbi:MAG: hypothetical protein IPI41_07465 [Flavobacteriales bacterium]|nr:hypothetical protein [Flavobacteriales bacterium]
MRVTLGMNNTDYVPNSTAVFNAADRLLVVGNGAAPATRSDALVILKNGNTGIGSSTPAARLHVVGNIRMVDGNQAAGRVLVSDANGTGTWTDPLTVASGTAWTLTGNAGTNPATNFLGTTDAQPLRLRVGNSFAGQLSNTATGVVSYGLGAGAVNTGNRNTFVGSGAGDANTTGVDNTFLGHDAGGANTTSVEGTFIGSGAGLSNSGVSNTFVGAGSGVSNSTGGGNTFLGRRTGFINSTGNGNTFLGTDAGNANVTGSDGTFVGRGAGQSNTASNNTFVGGRAGDANTTGTSNTFIGRDAGGANLTGSDGTFLGASAGLVNTGSNNTFVGSGAGDANTVGTGNTFISKDAGGANTEPTGEYIRGGPSRISELWITKHLRCGDSEVFANTSGSGNNLRR